MVLIKDLLLENLKKFNVTIDNLAFERLETYAEMLLERNQYVNLTAITEPDEVTVKHFADSLSVFSCETFQTGAKIADVGTGAGFPGLALLIVRPDLNVTLIDSTNKKLDFIRDVLEKLDLKADVVHMRAEEAGKNKLYREKFDVVTARAVAELGNLCEYCIPLVKQNGTFLAMKGPQIDEEISESRSAVRLLGGDVGDVTSFELSDGSLRNIVLIKKISQTPPKYPRASAQIAKNPLK